MPEHIPPVPDDAAPIAAPAMTPKLLAILGLCAFASAVSMRVLDPVMPLLAAEFGKTIHETALLTTLFTFSYAIGQPILGPVGDSFGKARLMSMALIGVSMCMLLASLAASFGIFGFARALTGLAAGGVIPLGIALIGDRAPLEQRQMLLAQFMMATLSGQIAGGLIAGGLSPFVGWRSVLMIVAAIAFAAGVIAWISVKPRPSSDRPPLNVRSIIRNYSAIFHNPRAMPLFALVAAEGALVFGLFPYVAEILKSRDGSGSLEAGVAIGGFAVGGLIFSIFAKILFRRLTTAQMARTGGILIASSYLLFAIQGLPWWTAVPVFTVSGFGFYFLHNNFQAQATTLSETARASAVALFACFLFAGSAFGPPLCGFLINTAGVTGMLSITAALIVMLGMMVPLILKPA